MSDLDTTQHTASHATTTGRAPAWTFQELEVDDGNVDDAHLAIGDWPCVGIVDPSAGGVVAYASEAAARQIVNALNGASRTPLPVDLTPEAEGMPLPEVSIFRSDLDGALVVQVDTGGVPGRIRVNLNDAPIWDGDPNTDDFPGRFFPND